VFMGQRVGRGVYVESGGRNNNPEAWVSGRNRWVLMVAKRATVLKCKCHSTMFSFSTIIVVWLWEVFWDRSEAGRSRKADGTEMGLRVLVGKQFTGILIIPGCRRPAPILVSILPLLA
jgi:hypothetical protein